MTHITNNDPLMATICVVVAFWGFVATLTVIGHITKRLDTRRRFRPYDGGCEHSAHTCASCFIDRLDDAPMSWDAHVRSTKERKSQS